MHMYTEIKYIKSQFTNIEVLYIHNIIVLSQRYRVLITELLEEIDVQTETVILQCLSSPGEGTSL